MFATVYLANNRGWPDFLERNFANRIRCCSVSR
jgi:hypothetical protein